MRHKIKKTRKDKGYAILLAMLIVLFALLIGSSIYLLVSRELALSRLVRESMRAYYTSESGTECARYWSVLNRLYFAKLVDFVTLPIGSPFRTIHCNGADIALAPFPSGTDTLYRFTFDQGGELETEIEVVRKNDAIRNLDIDSNGYNTLATDLTTRRVQRFKRINIAGLCDAAPDIVLTVDTSNSIQEVLRVYTDPDTGGAESIGGVPTEWGLLKTALRQFVSVINPSSSTAHIGLVSFSNIGRVNKRIDANFTIADIETLEGGAYTNMAHGLRRTRYELQGLDHNGVYDPSPPWFGYITAYARGFPTSGKDINPGLDASDIVSITNDERPNDDLHPDYIVLITDGAPGTVISDGTTLAPNPPGGLITNGFFHINHTYTGHPEPTNGVLTEAQAAKNLGIEIFVIGIDVPNSTTSSTDDCEAYPGGDCNLFLMDVASNPSYYFPVANFADIENVLKNFAACVKPIIDK